MGEERQVGLTVVLAGAFWLAGVAIVVGGTLLSMYGVPAIGVTCCLIGAVINVRGFFTSYGQLLRDAFEGGREYERARSHEGLTSVR